MRNYYIEWIKHMRAYRLYESYAPEWTVAYLDSLKEAIERVREDGDNLTYINDDGYHYKLVVGGIKA